MFCPKKQFGSESFRDEKGKRGFFVRKGMADSREEELSVENVKKDRKDI